MLPALYYFTSDRGPRQFHAWVGEKASAVIAQWPEQLDRTRNSGPPSHFNRWGETDAIILADRRFGFTFDMPEAPLTIPTTRLVWMDMTGGRLTSISVTLSDRYQTAAEAAATLKWIVDELNARGWVSAAPQQIMLPTRPESKKFVTLKRTHFPEAQLTIQCRTPAKYLIDLEFMDDAFQDRLYAISKRLGFSNPFAVVEDSAAYWAAIDRALAAPE